MPRWSASASESSRSCWAMAFTARSTTDMAASSAREITLRSLLQSSADGVPSIQGSRLCRVARFAVSAAAPRLLASAEARGRQAGCDGENDEGPADHDGRGHREAEDAALDVTTREGAG